jgi:hypothetical protein
MEQSQKMGHTKNSGNGQGWRKVNGRELPNWRAKIKNTREKEGQK